jgi:tRNA (cmo5U34)-methyltransferase
MDIGKAFDDTINYYDNWMKKALPNYHDLFASAVDIIPFSTDASIKTLDLGAGTGLFSSHVFKKYPNGHFVLYDLGEKMLEAAKSRFSEYPEQFEAFVGDYREMQGMKDFDLVISSLSIHHLTDDEKQSLFGEIFKCLNSGGIFINIDQVRGETAAIRDMYWTHWLEQVNKSEAPETQIQESIQRRVTFDKDALMMDQLLWLKNAGFIDVDCIYKNFFVGVFYGRKSAPLP